MSPSQATERLQQVQNALKDPAKIEDPRMKWPKLPARAAYLTLNNARRRNALSLAVLRDLRDQLHSFNTSPKDGKLKILPPFRPEILEQLEQIHTGKSREVNDDYDWLLDSSAWQTHREGLPNVLILRSDGPVFSAGHDLGELRQLPYEEVKETFALCAEVMSLIRRSPAPVIGFIQGLATAAGAQLALTTDLPVTCGTTQFRLPGASLGLPCTSPSTAVSRKVGNAFTYRMLALAEPVSADDLPGGAVETVPDSSSLETRVSEMVEKLAGTAGQPQALGKWAFHTQAGMRGGGDGDGYEAAVAWAGRVMALHARSADAQEGMNSFFEKRSPDWKT
jgi:enoyl-CoA hydratase/carnithine racemase